MNCHACRAEMCTEGLLSKLRCAECRQGDECFLDQGRLYTLNFNHLEKAEGYGAGVSSDLLTPQKMMINPRRFSGR